MIKLILHYQILSFKQSFSKFQAKEWAILRFFKVRNPNKSPIKGLTLSFEYHRQDQSY